ncbi:MAG: hypothetical protein KAR62_07745 [Sphingomonadales bacterium]|nr:hypothetical protein [Sphingomonadales bacterium]
MLKQKTHYNPHRGEVVLNMDGEDIILVPSFNNLVATEQQTKLGLIELATLMQSNSLPLEKIVEVILCASEPEISTEVLQKQIEQNGIAKPYEAVARFLAGVISAGGAEGGKTPKPGKSKPKVAKKTTP